MDDKLVKQVTELVLNAIGNSITRESDKAEIPLGISARHIHLTKEHVEILFGKGHELTIKKILMGGQYASEECVTVVSSKLKSIENIRVLGPCRDFSQLEISKTDAIKLGMNPPYRQSGDIKGSESFSIVGPCGVVHLNEGCIIAKRHIHMSPLDADKFGVIDKDIVSVHFDGERAGVLEGVLVRVDKNYTLEMHIDTDEANGLGLTARSLASITK